MSETAAESESQSGWPMLVAMETDATMRIRDKYATTKPRAEAQADAINGKWGKMKDCIQNHAQQAWKSSQFEGDPDALQTAEALLRLVQSL